MRYSKFIVLSAVVCASMLSFAQTAAAATSHEITSFYDDSQLYKIGDVVPSVYRTKPYDIVDWQKRNLPAPLSGSHWTYIGGSYALITDAEGKILRAESGDIFFANE